MKKVFTLLFFLTMFTLFAQQNFTYEYQLPDIDTNYYHSAPSGVTNFLLEVTLFPTDIDWPFVSLNPGEIIKIEYMIPAGCAYANITGESNDWQAGPSLYTQAGSFDYNPAQFYLGTRPVTDTLNCYESDLGAVTAALNVVVYGNGTPSYPVTTTEESKFFTLYYPIGASGTFEFGNIKFNLLIMDVDAYTTWQEEYFSPSTSIESTDNNDFKIYPNPVTNSLQLIINNVKLGDNVQIIDITGKVIKQIKKKNLLADRQGSELKIQTDDLQNGVYFVRIGNTIKKIIKE